MSDIQDCRELAAMVNTLRDEMREADRVATSLPRAARHQHYRQLEDRQRIIMRRLAVEFGRRHGWQLSDSAFAILTLRLGKARAGQYRRNCDETIPGGHDGRLMDHPYYYRKDGKAAAVAAHLYDWPTIADDCRVYAEQRGLTLLVPDFPSWWFPGSTTLVVYVGPAGCGHV